MIPESPLPETAPHEPSAIVHLANQIADRIFPYSHERGARNALQELLVEFAAEVRRGSIEP